MLSEERELEGGEGRKERKKEEERRRKQKRNRQNERSFDASTKAP